MARPKVTVYKTFTVVAKLPVVIGKSILCMFRLTMTIDKTRAIIGSSSVLANKPIKIIGRLPVTLFLTEKNIRPLQGVFGTYTNAPCKILNHKLQFYWFFKCWFYDF